MPSMVRISIDEVKAKVVSMKKKKALKKPVMSSQGSEEAHQIEEGVRNLPRELATLVSLVERGPLKLFIRVQCCPSRVPKREWHVGSLGRVPTRGCTMRGAFFRREPMLCHDLSQLSLPTANKEALSGCDPLELYKSFIERLVLAM